MYQLALIYLACILAGFSLANLPTAGFISADIANLFEIIGGLVIIVFAIALIILGIKVLLGKAK